MSVALAAINRHVGAGRLALSKRLGPGLTHVGGAPLLQGRSKLWRSGACTSAAAASTGRRRFFHTILLHAHDWRHTARQSAAQPFIPGPSTGCPVLHRPPALPQPIQRGPCPAALCSFVVEADIEMGGQMRIPRVCPTQKRECKSKEFRWGAWLCLHAGAVNHCCCRGARVFFEAPGLPEHVAFPACHTVWRRPTAPVHWHQRAFAAPRAMSCRHDDGMSAFTNWQEVRIQEQEQGGSGSPRALTVLLLDDLADAGVQVGGGCPSLGLPPAGQTHCQQNCSCKALRCAQGAAFLPVECSC